MPRIRSKRPTILIYKMLMPRRMLVAAVEEENKLPLLSILVSINVNLPPWSKVNKDMVSAVYNSSTLLWSPGKKETEMDRFRHYVNEKHNLQLGKLRLIIQKTIASYMNGLVLKSLCFGKTCGILLTLCHLSPLRK